MGLFDYIDMLMTEEQAQECAKSGVIYTPYVPLQVSKVMIKTTVTLHLEECDCPACCPYHVAARRHPYGPGQVLSVSLADGESPPKGWKRVPKDPNSSLP
jgi:hypothetical protein